MGDSMKANSVEGNAKSSRVVFQDGVVIVPIGAGTTLSKEVVCNGLPHLFWWYNAPVNPNATIRVEFARGRSGGTDVWATLIPDVAFPGGSVTADRYFGCRKIRLVVTGVLGNPGFALDYRIGAGA